MNRKKPKKQHYFVMKKRTTDDEPEAMIDFLESAEKISLFNEQSEDDSELYRAESELFCSDSDQTNSSN